MNLMIRCMSCDKEFLGCYDTLRVQGTIITLDCPHCNEHSVSNISKFCEDQIGDVDNRLQKTRLMVKLSKIVNRQFNSDRGN